MPIQVTCPHCSKTINAPDKFAGKTANCPGCKKPIQIPISEQDFVAPDFGATAAPPPPIQIKAIQSVAINDGLQSQQNNVAGVFDFRLKKYYTLTILRITWAFVILLALLLLIDSFISLLSGESLFNPFGFFSSPPKFEIRNGQIAVEEDTIGDAVRQFMQFIVKGIAIVMFLLYARVMIEGIAVIFNTANSIHGIERQLMRRNDTIEHNGSV